MKEIIFLKIIDRKIPADIIYETEFIIVIKDINPQAPIHFLIIPKKQFKTISDIPKEEFFYFSEIFTAIQYLSKTIPKADQYKIISMYSFINKPINYDIKCKDYTIMYTISKN